MDKKTNRMLMLVAAIAAAAIIYYLVLVPARKQDAELEAQSLKNDARKLQIEGKKAQNKVDDLKAKIRSKAYSIGKAWENKYRRDNYGSVAQSKDGLSNHFAVSDMIKTLKKWPAAYVFLPKAIQSLDPEEIPEGFQVSLDNGRGLITSIYTDENYYVTYDYIMEVLAPQISS